MAGGAIKVTYTGADDSCLLIADSTAKTLTSKTGAVGAEAVDAAFGVAGVLDLSDAANDTLTELVAVIDAYADYSCEIQYGDGTYETENILDAEVQAKGTDAYILFTVDSLLAAHALISWEFTQDVLGLKDNEQVKFERLINAASHRANRITRHYLKALDYTEILDGTGRPTLLLSEYPVNSVSSLHIDTAWTYGADTEETDYLIYEKVGELRLKSGTFTEWPQCVKVVYNAGYVDVPDDLAMAVVEVVAFNASRVAGRGSLIGTKSFQAENALATSYELTIPVNAQIVFEGYRREV